MIHIHAFDAFLRTSSYTRCLIVSDTSVFPLYGEQIKKLISLHIPVHTLTFPPGERVKTLESAAACWTFMHEHRLDRKSLVVSLGGGAISDLSGYVAGCYMRGIDVVHIPTTLMGMVDASIGGKTAVNLPGGKNLVGVFHQPAKVIISLDYLETLPERELCSGLAEVIKYGVIYDPQLFSFLEENMEKILKRDQNCLHYIVERSIAIKSEIVKADEREAGLRAILNWGHTFAHALETLTEYSVYLHGEAVAIGMHCAASVSLAIGLTNKELVERQKKLCELAKLPTALPENFSMNEMINVMRSDKKAANGNISLILAKQLGEVLKVDNVDPEVIKNVWQK